MAGAPQPNPTAPLIDTPAPAPTPDATKQPGASPAAVGAAAIPATAPWYADFKDPDVKGFAELNAHSLTGPEAAVRDLREAQKLIGTPKGELLRIPTDISKATPEQMDAIHARLGRPPTSTEYKLDTVASDDPLRVEVLPALHKAGYTQDQVTAGLAAINAFNAKQEEAKANARIQQEELDTQQLHREWPGEVYGQRAEMGRRAIREFAVPIFGDKTPETLDKIEGAIGTAGILKLFASIGEKVGESKYVDSGHGPNFGMTPAAAKARLEELNDDREFTAKVYNNPKGPESREWNRLIELAAKAQ